MDEPPYISRDAYMSILEQADDRTILNMLSVNKTYHNKELFKRIMSRRYPLLIKYKNSNETWKKFYMRMTYYLSVLKEEYNLPYIPHQDFSPRYLYSHRHDRKYLTELAFRYAAGVGDINLVKYFIDEGVADLNPGMVSAAGGGHMDLVKYLISLGANNFNGAMSLAAYRGEMDMIKYLISLGATNFNRALSQAAYGGHIDLVKYLISLGAANLNSALLSAAEGGHMDVVKYLISLGATNFYDAMAAASYAGERDMIEFLKTVYK